MKKLISIIVLMFLFSIPAFAHGGFEKIAENTNVYVIQEPTSPLVGEKVNFTFQFKDPTVKASKDLSVQNLVNIPVEISIVDTFEGDESKDKVIYKKEFKTDENGNISFSYVFTKENYFDIDLSYEDHNGNVQQTGFLVQPRRVETKTKIETKEIGSRSLTISMLVIGLVVGIIIGRRIRR